MSTTSQWRNRISRLLLFGYVASLVSPPALAYAPCACRVEIPSGFTEGLVRARESGGGPFSFEAPSCSISFGEEFPNVSTARDIQVAVRFSGPSEAVIEGMRGRAPGFEFKGKAFGSTKWSLGKPTRACPNRVNLEGRSEGNVTGCFVLDVGGSIARRGMPIEISGRFDYRGKHVLDLELTGRGDPMKLLGFKR